MCFVTKWMFALFARLLASILCTAVSAVASYEMMHSRQRAASRDDQCTSFLCRRWSTCSSRQRRSAGHVSKHDVTVV